MQHHVGEAALLDRDGAVVRGPLEVDRKGQSLAVRPVESGAADAVLDRLLLECTQLMEAQRHASAVTVCGKAVRMEGAAARNPANAAAYEHLGMPLGARSA